MKLRVFFSEQCQKYVVKERVFFFFWVTLGDHEFDSLEEAQEFIAECPADDWKMV